MNRQQIIDFCNKNIFTQIDSAVSQFLDCWEVVRMVSRWRIGKPVNVPMVARVDD